MQKNPWAFIPSLYFVEGLPYILINVVSAALYTKMGIPNDIFAFWTGFLYLPWTLKMFWSPLVDGRSTKRKWLLACQFLSAFIFFFIALCLGWNSFFAASLGGFMIGAFISATYDIATDGYYMLALSPERQGYFIGIRTIFYRLAMIFGGGTLLMLIGLLETSTQSVPLAWRLGMGGMGLLFLLFAFYHAWILPLPEEDKPAVSAGEKPVFAEVFKTYFSQKKIAYILLFILLYRLGDAMLEKIITPFLIGEPETGALGLTTTQLGFIKGTLGLAAVIAGNLTGGFLLGKFGFKKCIWPFALVLILPNFFYVYMAYCTPSVTTVAALITLEHFGNGLALMAFMVFIMYVSQGKYKTSHYAISTGIMAIGMMLPSMLSGKLQVALGYKHFFVAVAVLSVCMLSVIPLTFKIKSIEQTEQSFKKHKMSLADAE